MPENGRNKLNIFVISLQESFIALVPYFLLSSFSIVFAQAVGHFGAENADTVLIVKYVSQMINRFTGTVVLISIAYHFAARYNISQIITILLSLAVFITLNSYESHAAHGVFLLPYGLNFSTLSIPVLATFTLKFLMKRLQIQTTYAEASIYVCKMFRYIFPFVAAFAFLTAIYIAGYYLADTLMSVMKFADSSIPDRVQLAFRVFTSQLSWFFGIHGPLMANTFLNNSFLQHSFFGNLDYREFYRFFTFFGGSGMGLSLILAILINKIDTHSIRIAKLAFPFAVFNINEILIFGLPIVFNRYLFFPFVFGPLINMAVAYAVLSIYPIQFADIGVTWTTPVFIDTYMATGGGMAAPMLQLFLLLLGTAIYYPFVKRYTKIQSSKNHLKTLEKKLDIISSLRAREGLSSHIAQRAIIQSSCRVDEIIRMLDKEHLMVYYQPKIDLHSNRCYSYEALLRLRLKNGEITGPFFLEDLEKAGLATVIDIWVCKEVKMNIEKWEKSAFHPHISINLHPDTLHDEKAIEKIKKILHGKNIEFEIIERSLIDADEGLKNLYSLKEGGFKIAIDDFGTGYSSFETIFSFDIDTIKLDKSMTDIITNPKGYHVCKHAFSLFEDLSIECIAEGVETEEQMKLLRKIGARYVQGYYFSQALPFDKVTSYATPAVDR